MSRNTICAGELRSAVVCMVAPTEYFDAAEELPVWSRAELDWCSNAAAIDSEHRLAARPVAPGASEVRSVTDGGLEIRPTRWTRSKLREQPQGRMRRCRRTHTNVHRCAIPAVVGGRR
jgi:hypothetical protein